MIAALARHLREVAVAHLTHESGFAPEPVGDDLLPLGRSYMGTAPYACSFRLRAGNGPNGTQTVTVIVLEDYVL